MKFYLGYRSAIQYWLSDELRAWFSARKAQTRFAPDPPSGDEWEKVYRECMFAGFTSPIELLVSHGRDDRGSRPEMQCHLFRTDTRPSSFVQIDDSLFVPAPELAYVQMCRELAIPQAIVLGYELCGSYARTRSSEVGMENSRPATKAARLIAAMNRYERVKGVSTARVAAKYVLDASASPMETVQAILYTASPKIGGYGIKGAVLNYEVELDETARSIYPHLTCRCDLYLPNARLDIEYESEEYHNGLKLENSDIPRGNALKHMGINIVQMTKRQLYDPYAFDAIARLVVRESGHRVRNERFGVTTQRLELREDLLNPEKAFVVL